MSSTASLNQWSAHAWGLEEPGDPGARWPLAGSFVLHLVVMVIVGLRFAPSMDPTEPAYQVSLVALSAPVARDTPRPSPQALPTFSPVPKIKSLPPLQTPAPREAPVRPPEPSHPMTELLTEAIQAVRIPDIKTPPPVDTVKPVPKTPPPPDVRVRDVAPPVAPPAPPSLAEVRVAPAPVTSSAARERRESAIAALAIPDLVSELTVRRPVTPDARATPADAASQENAPSLGASYWDDVRNRIHKQWFVPERQGLDPLRVILAFRVERTGRVTALTVNQSSGRDEYDVRAKRAVATAGPFPAFPRHIPDAYYDVNFTFIFRFSE